MTNADKIAAFTGALKSRALPSDVIDAACFAIADWFGVAIGAADQKPIGALQRVVDSWQGNGRAHVLLGGRTASGLAALLNGTMAHCLDFDDTHVRSIAHLSGPTFAAAYAIGTELAARPDTILRAFIAGFEVGGRVGGGGFGVAVNERHIHSTGVCGCIGAATTAGFLYDLDSDGIKRALGLAATQVSGLTGSFGTSGKPFHAGKAAMNGILAAQMAREGFDASVDLLEPRSGLDCALVQDQSVTIHPFDFEEGWEITRNTFKPYASCLLTHPVIDAGRKVAGTVDLAGISEIKVRVHPLAIQLAGKSDPRTPFEGKFSLAFCVALAIMGHSLTQLDFTLESVENSKVRAILQKVSLEADPQMEKTAGEIELVSVNGERHIERTPLALGNPGNPMSWDDLRTKFESLVEPILGRHATELFAALRRFDQVSDIDSVIKLTSERESVVPAV